MLVDNHISQNLAAGFEGEIVGPACAEDNQ